MTHIFLSSRPDEIGLLIVLIAVLALNIFLIVKFLELTKDVKSILIVLQGISRDSKSTASAVQSSQGDSQAIMLSPEELNKRIVGTWSCVGNIVYNINADGTYEMKKYKISGDNDMVKKITGFSIGSNNKIRTYEEKDVVEIVKGSWHIERNYITFTSEETKNANEVKDNTFEIVDFGLTTMKFVNSLTHSVFRLNRI
jgi:hypothetical protein